MNTNYPVPLPPPPPPLTRKSLDAALTHGCLNPFCTQPHQPVSEIYLKACCHPAAGLSACYLAGGVLVLACAECKRVVVNIAVQP